MTAVSGDQSAPLGGKRSRYLICDAVAGGVPGRPLARAAEMLPDDTAEEIRALAVQSHVLEASVRRAILEQLQAQGSEVVGAKEILDLAEAFAWVTNPGQAHGGGR